MDERSSKQNHSRERPFCSTLSCDSVEFGVFHQKFATAKSVYCNSIKYSLALVSLKRCQKTQSELGKQAMRVLAPKKIASMHLVDPSSNEDTMQLYLRMNCRKKASSPSCNIRSSCMRTWILLEEPHFSTKKRADPCQSLVFLDEPTILLPQILCFQVPVNFCTEKNEAK